MVTPIAPSIIRSKRWEHWENLLPELENELIEKIAQYVVDHNLSLMADISLDTGGSITTLFATLGMAMFGPYLEFFGADTYTALFRRKENVKRLMDRIEELEEEEKSKVKKHKIKL